MIQNNSSDVTPLDALAAAALHGGPHAGHVTQHTDEPDHASFEAPPGSIDPLLAAVANVPGGKRRRNDEDDDAFAFASAEKRVRRPKEDWEDFPSGDFDVNFNPPLKSAWKDSWSWRSLKSTKLTSGSKIARACQGLLECSQKCGFTERPFVHGNKLESQKKGSRCQICGAEMVHLPCSAKSSIVKDSEGRIAAFEHQGAHPHPRPSLKRGLGQASQRSPSSWTPTDGVSSGDRPPSANNSHPPTAHLGGSTARAGVDTSADLQQPPHHPAQPLPPVLKLDRATLTKPFCVFCSRPWNVILVNSGPSGLSDKGKSQHLLDSHRFDLARIIALDPQLDLRFETI